MKRKNDITTMDLKIDNVIIKDDAIRIQWSSKIGFGDYDIYLEGGKLIGHSECMDSNGDKDFLKALLNLLPEKIKIVS